MSEEKLKELEAKIIAYKSEIQQDVDSKMNALKSENYKIVKENGALEYRLESLEKKYDDVVRKNTALESGQVVLKDKNDGLEALVGELERKSTEESVRYKSEVSALKERISQLENTVLELTNKNGAVERSVMKLEEEDFGGRIAAFHGEMEMLAKILEGRRESQQNGESLFFH